MPRQSVSAHVMAVTELIFELYFLMGDWGGSTRELMELSKTVKPSNHSFDSHSEERKEKRFKFVFVLTKQVFKSLPPTQPTPLWPGFLHLTKSLTEGDG